MNNWLEIDHGILQISEIEAVILHSSVNWIEVAGRNQADGKRYWLQLFTKSGQSYTRSCGVNEDGRARAADIRGYILKQTGGL